MHYIAICISFLSLLINVVLMFYCFMFVAKHRKQLNKILQQNKKVHTNSKYSFLDEKLRQLQFGTFSPIKGKQIQK